LRSFLGPVGTSTRSELLEEDLASSSGTVGGLVVADEPEVRVDASTEPEVEVDAGAGGK